MHRRLLFALPLLIGVRPALARDNAPIVIRTIPASGLYEVDPEIKVLEIQFDQPMRNSWSFVKAREGAWPNIVEPNFHQPHVLRAGVSLLPGTTYAFGLNSFNHINFRNDAGVALAPTLVRFTTAGHRAPTPI